jgi:hypothetical protein
MNHVVAYELLTSELAAYRNLPFDELHELVGERSSRQVRGRDGVDYDLAIFVRWRLQAGGDMRVHAFIGEANWGSAHDQLATASWFQTPRLALKSTITAHVSRDPKVRRRGARVVTGIASLERSMPSSAWAFALRQDMATSADLRNGFA